MAIKITHQKQVAEAAELAAAQLEAAIHIVDEKCTGFAKEFKMQLTAATVQAIATNYAVLASKD